MGAADMFSVFVRGTLIQLNTPDHMRGRVSAASGLAISASNELGEMRAGAMAALLGPVGAVVIGGAGAGGVPALWSGLFPELDRKGVVQGKVVSVRLDPGGGRTH